MAPFFGNSVACRIAEAHEIKHSTLVLGDWRAAQRIEFYIGREPPPLATADAGREVQAAAALLGEGQPAGRRQAGRCTRGGGGSRDASSDSIDCGADERQRAGSSGGGAASSGERSVLSGGAGGFKVWVVNTHLDHEHTDNRQRQVRRRLGWQRASGAPAEAFAACAIPAPDPLTLALTHMRARGPQLTLTCSLAPGAPRRAGPGGVRVDGC